jgi:hypothetical protein
LVPWGEDAPGSLPSIRRYPFSRGTGSDLRRLIGIGRILVGLHYPGDIAGGAFIGLIAAGFVFWFSDGRITGLVGLASRITDPVVRPGWRALDEGRSSQDWPVRVSMAGL